jgi:hypothetical protein
MPDYKWFRIRSWHLIDKVEPDRVYARCGRSRPHPVEAADTLSADVKSCERCLLFAARDHDKGIA